jgi:CrtC N-terminal lipocalin domain
VPPIDASEMMHRVDHVKPSINSIHAQCKSTNALASSARLRRTNAVRFVAGEYSSEWSYNGDTMNLTVASPQLSYGLRLTGADQVMYAKDKLGIKGFIQEGAQEDRSYYYSLPRVEIVGRITYSGKGGVRHEIDVTGQGWVDRQSR